MLFKTSQALHGILEAVEESNLFCCNSPGMGGFLQVPEKPEFG